SFSNRGGSVVVGCRSWLTMELPDVTLNQTIYCTPGHGAHFGTVDDLTIIVYVSGLNGAMARASACRRRADTLTPIVGFIHFSDDYLDRLVESGKLTGTAVHEIAHVLGFGITWDRLNLTNGRLPNPHFTGSRAIAAFNAAGGTSYTRPKVPTTNNFSHWPGSIFSPEVMSSTSHFAVRDPLSAVTLAALADMGYVVDLSYAEDFSISNTGSMAADATPENVIYRGDDVHRGPVVLVDRNGRTVRVIPRFLALSAQRCGMA
ncbi:leishmanolysin-related zinc metalloendopeptidase, partial [Candidatus Palauibacter sp.]|uniref:leishmanolysin-related zinc metalloendopeptidase n=1 Tax=Candidatus Palauibacter sp. TaxID=3101350 RepID=UPI003AF1FD81